MVLLYWMTISWVWKNRKEYHWQTSLIIFMNIAQMISDWLYHREDSGNTRECHALHSVYRMAGIFVGETQFTSWPGSIIKTATDRMHPIHTGLYVFGQIHDTCVYIFMKNSVMFSVIHIIGNDWHKVIKSCIVVVFKHSILPVSSKKCMKVYTWV